MISSGPAGRAGRKFAVWLRARWRFHVWLFPASAGILTVVLLCWGGWRYGYDPRWLSRVRAWWTPALAPGQNWTLVGALALGMAGLAAFWWPRRHDRVPIGLLIVSVMVVVAAALGTASYAPCHGTMGVTGVMFWVLQLYVGQPPNLYQPPYQNLASPVCAGPPPPSLQAAQVIGLGATLIGFVALGMVLWREPVQRLQSRFTAHATVFTGLDTLTLPLLRELAETAKTTLRNPRSVIVIEPDESNPLLDEARTTGARVIMGDPASPELLQPILAGGFLAGGWRRCALDRLYALSSRVPENAAVIRAAGRILRKYPPATDHQTHLIVRVDDPRHADAWRGRHVRTDGRWFVDALSPAEVTARALVDRVLAAKPRRLLVCGDNSLALAVLAELARRSWEQAELIEASADGHSTGPPEAFAPGAQQPAPIPLPVDRVTLLDARAEQINREYRASVPKAMLAAAPEVETDTRRWREYLLRKLDDMSPVDARRTAVIIVDGPDEKCAHEAGRVARLHQKTPVFLLAATGAGMPDAIFDRLQPFELGLRLTPGAIPEDSWTRIARHWHECYRLRHPVPPGDPKAVKRLPWEQLSQQLRDDNILQVRSILKLVAEQGRKWVPVRMVPSGSHVELNAAEIDDIASREHERWLARQSPQDRAGNPNARPWAERQETEREESRRELISQLTLLAAVGFLPTIPAGGPPGADGFLRTGTVQARRLTSRMPWRLRGGEVLHGNPGDWHVVDAAGNERTVTDPEFQVSHENLGNGQWKRVGTFRAWRVTGDQVVWTKEGKVTAKAGGWIVEGPGGERWPVSHDHFRRNYRRAGDPALPDQASTAAAVSSSTAPADSS